MLVALILGELFGYTLTQLHRNAFLRSHASRLAREAEERAASAERKSALLAIERGADSRLNHLIKSKCGASLQLAWLLRGKMRQAGIGSDAASSGHAATTAVTNAPAAEAAGGGDDAAARRRCVELEELMSMSDAHLALISTQLEAVMDWVHRRQVCRKHHTRRLLPTAAGLDTAAWRLPPARCHS